MRAVDDVSFTVDKPDLAKALQSIDALKADVGFEEIETDEKIGKLSLVGVGMVRRRAQA